MLFDIDNVSRDSSTGLSQFKEITNKHNAFISSQNDYLSKKLKELDFTEKRRTWHFTSNGRFALHDIVILIANRIDLPDVTITSFNLSVIAAKTLIRAYDKGIFKSLRFVLNAQKKSNFQEAVNLIEGKFPIVFTRIHAKVALINNKRQYITVNTSGNLSNNNNYERGYISTNKYIWQFDNKWISALFD